MLVTCNPKHTNDVVFISLLFSVLSQGRVSNHLQMIQVKHTLSRTHTGRIVAAGLLNLIFQNVPFPSVSLLNSRCQGELNKCGPSNKSGSGSVLLFVAVKLLLMLICFVTVNLSASVNPFFFCALRECAELVAPLGASTVQAGTNGTMHSTNGWR